ncbi:MAG: hypothetical protein WA239_28450, partial [Candidatus Sulfotelmatobacter sp.]
AWQHKASKDQYATYVPLFMRGCIDGFNGITQLLLLALEPSLSDSKANDFLDTVNKWIRDARRYLTKVEQGKVVNPTVVTMQNREIKKMMRHLRSVKPSVSQTSKLEP